MYIQAARYVLKSYAGYKLKGKKLTDSVGYIAELEKLEGVVVSGERPWEMGDMRVVLLRAIEYVIREVTGRIAGKKEGETEIELLNYQLGGRLQQLAQLHGSFYTLNAFIEAIKAEKNPHILPVITDLCLLFGMGQIQKLGQPIVESGVVSPQAMNALTPLREDILSRLRPTLVGLLDSLAIPDKYVRSELTQGHPYNVPPLSHRTSSTRPVSARSTTPSSNPQRWWPSFPRFWPRNPCLYLASDAHIHLCHPYNHVHVCMSIEAHTITSHSSKEGLLLFTMALPIAPIQASFSAPDDALK